MLLLALFFLNINAQANTCDKFSEFAKYDCAKAGDDAAAMGDYSTALKYWKVSCEKGLSGSCDYISEYNSNKENFRKKFDNNPATIVQTSLIKLNKLKMDCSEGTLKDDVCLTQIKTQFQNFPQETKEITELLCNQKNSSNACFELGASYVKGGDYESALQPYTQACALGHPTACNVLGPLQGNIKINDYRKFENAKISIEQNRENRELANERVKAVQKISESLQKGYQPPQKTKCRNGLEAGTIECETN